MPVEPLELVLISFFTGIGASFGQPIGQAMYKRIANKIRKMHKKVNGR